MKMYFFDTHIHIYTIDTLKIFSWFVIEIFFLWSNQLR